MMYFSLFVITLISSFRERKDFGLYKCPFMLYFWALMNGNIQSIRKSGLVPEEFWQSQSVEKLAFKLSADRPVRIFPRCFRRGYQRVDMHYGLEIGLVFSGSMRRHLYRHSLDVQAGQVWLCGVWEPHGGEVIKPSCEAVIFVIWPPLLSTLRFEEAPTLDWFAPFRAPAAKRPQIPEVMRSSMIALGQKIKRQLESGNLPPIWARLYLLEVLATLCEGGTIETGKQAVDPDSFQRINRVLELILTNRRMMSTQEAARVCGMGRKTFSRFFENLMGIRFAEFTLRHRLSGAATQLLQTNAPVKFIASQWGFTDASHFHRRFFAHYGCPPGAYCVKFYQMKSRSFKH